MRVLLTAIIWLFDVVLKFAIRYLILALVWLPFHLLSGSSFAFGWAIFGGILGACINGFFGGCDLILLGLAKRVSGDT